MMATDRAAWAGWPGQQRRGRFGLDRHQADVVRDDIVQLAGDGDPFPRRGAGGLAVHFGLGPVGPALGRAAGSPAGRG